MKYIGIIIGLVLFLALVLSSRGAWDASWTNLNAYGFIEPVHISNLVDAVNERTDLLVQRAYPYAYPASVTAHIEYVDCSSVSTGRYACSTTTTTYVESGVTNTIAYTNYCLHWTTICTTNDIKNDFIAGALLKAIDTKILKIIPYFVNQELEGTNHYSEWLSLTNMDFPYYTATGLFEVVGIMQSGKLYDVQSTGLYVCGTVTTNIGTNTYVYTNYCMGYVTNVITNAYFHDTGTNGTVYDFVSASNLLERYRVLNKLAWVRGGDHVMNIKWSGYAEISDTDCFKDPQYPPVWFSPCEEQGTLGSFGLYQWDQAGETSLTYSVRSYSEYRTLGAGLFNWVTTPSNILTRKMWGYCSATKYIGYGVSCVATQANPVVETYYQYSTLPTKCFSSPTDGGRKNYLTYHDSSSTIVDIADYVSSWHDDGLATNAVILSDTGFDPDEEITTYSVRPSCFTCNQNSHNICADCQVEHPEWFPEGCSGEWSSDEYQASINGPSSYNKISLIKYTPEFHE